MLANSTQTRAAVVDRFAVFDGACRNGVFHLRETVFFAISITLFSTAQLYGEQFNQPFEASQKHRGTQNVAATRQLRYWPAAMLLGAALILGCQNVPPVAQPGPQQQEAMLPTLTLNEDLYKSFKPSNKRDWTPEQAVLPTADFQGNQVTVHNIRDCQWRTLEDFTVRRYDKTFDLDKLRTVDFIVAPFNETPSLGHTMLSFGFEGGEYVALSVEIRKERGEGYSPVKGFFQQYEIIYVVASERDVIQRRVNCDLCDVYVYRSTATPERARELFADVMRRVNKLSKEPEFYDTLTNNCTTNIRRHINHLSPHAVPYDYRVLLPGYSDKLAYDLGLIERRGSYEETRLQARVNYLAYLHRDDPAFSEKIRVVPPSGDRRSASRSH